MARKLRTYRAHHIGRLRERAAQILQKQFPEWDVYPQDIHPATGRWRTDWRLDVYRWELFSQTKPSMVTGLSMPVVCGCWETLTKFVKRASKEGCHVNKDSEIYSGKE